MEPFEFDLNPNELIQHIEKPPEEFTIEDIVRFVKDRDVRFVNFRYVSEDSKLRTLSFVITSEAHLREILTRGERVDGSSIFSFVSKESSDLYVVPRIRTAFLNPFSVVPTLEFICTFFKPDGELFESAPDVVLRKALHFFRQETGMNFKALGELEYYVNASRNDLYPLPAQGGYHQAKPFSKFEDLRTEAMQLISRAGGKIKYGHSEVGSFSTRQEDFEQHEIEFLPQDADIAADQLILSKWILRMLSFDYGIEVSFSPKITIGKAGSGLHIHSLLEKDGKNVLSAGKGLSEQAHQMIAGLLQHAGALTAFGNTVPTSYFRLVPNQEAPTKISWGDLNRSALIRVPLGWENAGRLFTAANPGLGEPETPAESRQTIELRSADGSADIHLLLAGMIMAVYEGIQIKSAREITGKFYINDTDPYSKALPDLPDSCWASATELEKQRAFLEQGGVFPKELIDRVISKLKGFDDRELRKTIGNNKEALHKLVVKYIHVA